MGLTLARVASQATLYRIAMRPLRYVRPIWGTWRHPGVRLGSMCARGLESEIPCPYAENSLFVCQLDGHGWFAILDDWSRSTYAWMHPNRKVSVLLQSLACTHSVPRSGWIHHYRRFTSSDTAAFSFPSAALFLHQQASFDFKYLEKVLFAFKRPQCNKATQ